MAQSKVIDGFRVLALAAAFCQFLPAPKKRFILAEPAVEGERPRRTFGRQFPNREIFRDWQQFCNYKTRAYFHCARKRASV